MAKKPHSISFDSKLTTRWTEAVGEVPLPEYPRPQLRRHQWQNLNGLWQYTITPRIDSIPDSFEDQILVPFCIESRLSGVRRVLLPDQILWYKRSFDLPEDWITKRIRLHFGAVDWDARVFVNHSEVGSHRGGYLPFSFDITEYLVNGKNTLIVAVRDTTDAQMHQRGKQVLHPKGIFYTPCSGIWQTVWLEPLDQHSIASLKIVPDIDQARVNFGIIQYNEARNQAIEVEIGGRVWVFHGVETFDLDIEDPVYWTPSNPHLYDTKIRIIQEGKLLDEVETYFAMRKFSKGPDTNGQMRLMLNNEPIFHLGPLDQGYWPDGIYTAPTDEALVYDIEKTKEMGFNTIRKHVKVESARWYYHCDRLGMMVWQDMVNGGREGWNWRAWLSIIIKSTYIRDDASEKHLKLVGRADMALQEEFRQELREMIDSLNNFPCIAVWVPFNEGWGQFSAGEVGDWLMKYDPTRLVDTTSGFNLHGPTDVRSWHIYMRKLKMVEKSLNPNWVLAFSEAGGFGLRVQEHLWDETDRSRFYGNTKSGEKLLQKYNNLILDQLFPLVERGISAFIYTQTTDVETEVNGLLTYDREEKIGSSLINKINTEFLNLVSDYLKR